MIDLRSDTVTKPTSGMRQAMAEAAVGDDVLGDDPTVEALERRTADILGKEAAVYMPSGTMTNQVAIRAHTEPGDEMLCDANAHVYYYEAGAPAALSGGMVRLIDGDRGIYTAGDVRSALRPANIHFPQAKLICLENTHNRGGGSIWPIGQIADINVIARENGLRMHLDGARLWNASAATGIAESDYAQYFDTVSVCFSKGLGAPVGSALAGSSEFVRRARRFRKMFGGGMRQVGIIAAGALYALENNRSQLREDNANARRLAEGIAQIDGLEVTPSSVETNIVFFRVTAQPADDLVEKLAAANVAMLALGPHSVRAVTHLDVSSKDIDQAIEALRTAV